MLVNTPASWSEHDFRVQPDTMSGPAALVMSIFNRVDLTWWRWRTSSGSSLGGVVVSTAGVIVKMSKELVQDIRKRGVMAGL